MIIENYDSGKDNKYIYTVHTCKADNGYTESIIHDDAENDIGNLDTDDDDDDIKTQNLHINFLKLHNWHVTLPEDELREWLEEREDGRVMDEEPPSLSDRFEPLLSTWSSLPLPVSSLSTYSKTQQRACTVKYFFDKNKNKRKYILSKLYLLSI